MDDISQLPTLLKRRIQAQVIGPIYAEMVAVVGEEAASAILDSAIRKAAIAEGKAFAAKAPGGVTSMADFIKVYELWTHDGSLEIEVLEASDSAFNFDVTRCRYAEVLSSDGTWPHRPPDVLQSRWDLLPGLRSRDQDGPPAHNHGRRSALHVSLFV